jgi:hypothetical protein
MGINDDDHRSALDSAPDNNNQRPTHNYRSFCSVFHRGPCFHRYFPAIGQDLRLTIVSTDDNDPARKVDGDADTTAKDHTLDSISQMYAALRACWVPPPKDKAPHGMDSVLT